MQKPLTEATFRSIFAFVHLSATFFTILDEGVGKTDSSEKIEASEVKIKYKTIIKRIIVNIIKDLDTEESKKNGGLSFSEFSEIIQKRLGDRDTKEGVRRIFDLFVDDEKAEYIPLESLKKVAKELGDKMSEDDLKDMIECATKNEGKLSFDDFYYIISKK